MSFFKSIFSPICLIVSCLIFFYLLYQSEIVFDGINRDYYLIYFVISFLFIILSIVSFFIKKYKNYIIITVISIVFSIYTFESILVWNLKNPYINKIIETKKININYDNRSRYEIYNDLKKLNKNIVLTVSPSTHLKINNLEFFPLAGISKSETIYCNENGYYSIYNSDRYGFNNPDKEWDKKYTDYLIVGDSFTHGACVNRPYDISSQIREIKKYTVLNLGYGGNGPLIEYALLREYLKQNVRVVLWMFSEKNDLVDFESELKNKYLSQYLKNDNFNQDLKAKQNKIDEYLLKKIQINKSKIDKNIERKTETSKKNKYKNIKNFIKLKNIREIIFHFKKQKEVVNLENFKKIISKANQLVIENNSKLFFVYLPEYLRYTENNYSNSLYLEIKKIIHSLGIEFIDIDKEVFKISEEPLDLFPEKGGHYNQLGNKKIAIRLSEIIK